MCLGCSWIYPGDIGIANISVDKTNENARSRDFNMLVGVVKILDESNHELDMVQYYNNNSAKIKLVVRENRPWSGGVKFTYIIPLSEFTPYSVWDVKELTAIKRATIEASNQFTHSFSHQNMLDKKLSDQCEYCGSVSHTIDVCYYRINKEQLLKEEGKK